MNIDLKCRLMFSLYSKAVNVNKGKQWHRNLIIGLSLVHWCSVL